MSRGRITLAFILIIIAICYKVVEKPPIPDPDTINEYDPQYKGFDIDSPLLYGTPLAFFKYLLQTPIIGTFIARIIYTLNQFHVVRDFGYNLDVIPRYIPRRLCTDNEYTQHVKMSSTHAYKSILSPDINNLNKILGQSKASTTTNLLTVESIINSYKSNSKTPSDIIQQSLKAVDQLSHLNIFTQLNRQEIIQQAKESTARWKAGKPLSILDGIPIAIKDEYNVIGYNTTYGTSFMDKLHGESTKDDIIVGRIRALGAIIFGKTNMHEIGLFPSGYNLQFGTARNPYSVSLQHDTGGSSSGSAAAIASGIVPLALGADGGGSIRIPSGYNGIVGLKATYGRIPFLPQHAAWYVIYLMDFDGALGNICFCLIRSCVHVGFLANTVRDQAIGYMAVAGYGQNEGDVIMDSEKSLTNPPVHLYGFDEIDDLSDLNIGVYWPFFMDSQKEVRERCKEIVDILVGDYKAKLVNITIPNLQIISKAHSIMILSEWIQGDWRYINKEKIKGRTDYNYVDSTATTMLYAQQFDIVDLLSSMKIRNWIMQYFEKEIFGKNKVDIIITPMTGVTAPKYVMESLSSSVSDMKTVAKSVRFAFLGNFVGLPGMSVPVGYTEFDGDGEKFGDGSMFPVSIQLMGNHWNEHKLFRVGNLIEQKLMKRKLPPKQNRFDYEL